MRIAILAGAASLLCAAAPAAHAVSSAELYTTESYRYGRYEARIQFPPADGVVGSFFLWKDGSEVAGSYWNELDFEKLRGDCALQVNSIYGRPQAGHETTISGVTGLCTGYHSYVFEWTPDHIAWLVDGVEVRRDTGAAAQAYVANATDGMQLRFNIWPGTPAFGGTFSPASLPQHQFVSWVAYSSYVPGAAAGDSFALSWRESFEAGRPLGWTTGNWISPLQQSTHAFANVTFIDGVAVLSLTADDATGFTGTPPQDPGEQPTEHVPTGSAGSGGGSSTGGGGAGGQEPLPGSSSGCAACSVQTAPDSAPGNGLGNGLGSFGAFVLLAGLLVLLRHRS